MLVESIQKARSAEQDYSMRVLSELNEGELYVGAIISAIAVVKSHHIILLPETRHRYDWQDSSGWAESIGGELPDRTESALLYATMKHCFNPAWHWTREAYPLSAYAWRHDFGGGHQTISLKYNPCQAIAIRRLPI